KKEELTDIIADIKLTLGKEDPLTRLLTGIAAEYIDVIDLLLNRGTKKFWEYSKKLYGSPGDTFYGGEETVSKLGQLLYEILNGLDDSTLGPKYNEDIEAKEVVRRLNEKFKDYFDEDAVRAVLSDGIVADASAGGDTVKIREGSLFSKRDIRILEVHEGWVHVGTTLNGNRQPVAKWLSKGPPRCAATQEGLAVIMEIFTFNSYPRRARAINDRILAISKAEEGANLLDIIEFYRTEGYDEKDSFHNAKRVFRGGVIEGGAPFTKDISYCRGFIENYNFLRAAIRAGKTEMIPFLFCGKINVDDVPLLYQKHKEGIVEPPAYLPPQFRDLNGIAVWMSFSSFLNQVDLKKVQDHYDKLFRDHSD
ncbi:MAG: flavohemoglobin expression-modulating QEGLA motif protein, partial [Bdellovibrionota bacterium]